MTYQEIKNQLDESARILPDIAKYYNDEITGDELFNRIMKQVHFLNTDWPEAFEEFVSQVKSEKVFSQTKQLPVRSSGSFYTAWTDLDYFLEYDGITDEEGDELVKYAKKEFSKAFKEYWNKF